MVLRMQRGGDDLGLIRQVFDRRGEMHHLRQRFEPKHGDADRHRHHAAADEDRAATGVEQAELGRQQVEAGHQAARARCDEDQSQYKGDDRHLLFRFAQFIKMAAERQIALVAGGGAAV